MHTPTSLSAVRRAIDKRLRIRFNYERKEEMVADFYLLGHARKTMAYIVVAWCIEPHEVWRILRYSEIRDLQTMGPVDCFRNDFDPYNKEIAAIDTQLVGRVPKPAWA